MAKLLISCDDYIFLHDGKYYFKNQEWYRFYQRYLRVFEGLRIANRVIPEENLKKGRVPVDTSNIEIRPIPIFHGPIEYFKSYFAVGKAIRNVVDGCDAAILRLPSTVAQRLAPQVKRKQIPYACEVVFNAKDGYESSSSVMEKILWRVIDKRMRNICKNADGVSCVTEFQLQKRYYSKKTNHFSSHYSSLELPASFFSGPRQYPNKPHLTIAHVSNQIGLNGRKGEAVVIKALQALKNKGIEINLQFAGDDWDNSSKEIYSYAESLGVRNQVMCVGYLSRSELDEFLQKADLFVLPTKAEGLPRVIIEAMAKGLPTITTPVSGNPELISPPFLVDYDDVEKLSDVIFEIVTDKNLYVKASQDNFNKSLAYEASVLEKRRDAFYSELKNRLKK